MQSLHILYFQETRIKYYENILNFINYIYIYIIFDDRDLILLYDRNMMCSAMTINHHSASEFITTTFNEGRRKIIHVNILYQIYVTSIISFTNILKIFLNKIPFTCPFVILGDFNVDLGIEIHKSKYLQKFHLCMSKYHAKHYMSIATTKSNL